MLCLVPWQNGILMTSFWNQYYAIVASGADLRRHWYKSMADSVCHAPPIFHCHYKTEILSTETSDCLKQKKFFSHIIWCYICTKTNTLQIQCINVVRLRTFNKQLLEKCLGYTKVKITSLNLEILGNSLNIELNVLNSSVPVSFRSSPRLRTLWSWFSKLECE